MAGKPIEKEQSSEKTKDDAANRSEKMMKVDSMENNE